MPALPQFCLPLTLGGTLTVAFGTGSPLAVSVPTVTRHHTRSTDPNDDALAYLHSLLDAADSGGAWGFGEVSGSYKGRAFLTCDRNGAAGDGRTITSITFSGADLSGALYGFTADVVAPSLGGDGVHYWTAPHRRPSLWLPDPSRYVETALDEPRDSDTLLLTTSPGGRTSKLVLGGYRRRHVELLSLYAASVWPHYASKADFAASIGAATGDLNAAFDTFRRRWLALADGEVCRYYPDNGDTSTYVEVEPGQQDLWLGDLQLALTEVSRSLYRFDMALAFNEVG